MNSQFTQVFIAATATHTVLFSIKVFDWKKKIEHNKTQDSQRDVLSCLRIAQKPRERCLLVSEEQQRGKKKILAADTEHSKQGDYKAPRGTSESIIVRVLCKQRPTIERYGHQHDGVHEKYYQRN